MSREFKFPADPDNGTKINPGVVACPDCGVLFIRQLKSKTKSCGCCSRMVYECPCCHREEDAG